MKILNRHIKSIHKSDPKRAGRGISAGQGKTAGRGTKGQKSRAGHNIPNRFEGGQTALSMRLPKLRGFKRYKHKTQIITLDLISRSYKDGETVSIETLSEKKLIKKNDLVKILNTGKLSVKVKVDGIKFSKSLEGIFSKKEVLKEQPKAKALVKIDAKPKTKTDAKESTKSKVKKISKPKKPAEKK